MQVKSLILYLYLLVLRISLDCNLDGSHKNNRFSKTLLKKKFEFVPCRRYNTLAFNLGLLLLPVEVNIISEKQGLKKDMLEAHGISCVKMVLALLTEVLTLYVRATLVQVGIPGLESPIPECEICFSMFLALNKQF